MQLLELVVQHVPCLLMSTSKEAALVILKSRKLTGEWVWNITEQAVTQEHGLWEYCGNYTDVLAVDLRNFLALDIVVHMNDCPLKPHTETSQAQVQSKLKPCASLLHLMFSLPPCSPMYMFRTYSMVTFFNLRWFRVLFWTSVWSVTQAVCPPCRTLGRAVKADLMLQHIPLILFWKRTKL